MVIVGEELNEMPPLSFSSRRSRPASVWLYVFPLLCVAPARNLLLVPLRPRQRELMKFNLLADERGALLLFKLTRR